jgi:hypothetical protein
VWATWIVGGRQVTTLSYWFTFSAVLAAIHEHIDQVGAVGVNQQPVMLINDYQVNEEEAQELRDLPEGSVTLILM